MNNCHWSKLLSKEEIEARFALTASLDPRFAAQERTFYETRTVRQLEYIAAQSWATNEGEYFQLTKSLIAFMLIRLEPKGDL